LEEIVGKHMDDSWDEEQDAAMEDENVDESIRSNNYEFYENGERYRS
jgi:hypothetical protein